MTRTFTIVGFYTEKYKDDAGYMMQSCARVGAPVYCQEVPDRGSWELNTSFKPTFLVWCMEKLNTDLVYVDVDARIRKYPELFGRIEADIAFYKGNIWGRGHEEEVLSGTVFLAHNKKVQKFLYKWKEACDNNTGEWDQRLIEGSIEDGLLVERLPVEYCAIFDSPYVVGRELVIEHLQHSRRR